MRQDWNDEMEITTTGNNIASYHTVYNLDSFFRAKSKRNSLTGSSRWTYLIKRFIFSTSATILRANSPLFR